MSNITNSSPVVTEEKLKDFYEDIKPFLGCPAYVTQEGDAEYYSTDEKVIGRWHDGKPLYQRVLTGTTPSNNTNTIVLTLDSSIRTKNLFGWSGSVPIPYYGNTSWYLNAYMEGGYTLRMQVNGYNSMPFELVIQYTKETDSAVTTIEQKPTHYSTDEQVIGTWIDGKPLYQKTIIWQGNLPAGQTQIDPQISNIDAMIELKGTVFREQYFTNICEAESSTQMVNTYYHIGSHKICIDINKLAYNNATVRLTLQYTKTTDD